MDWFFSEAERIIAPILMAAATAFIGWLFVALRGWFNLEAGVSHEMAIRRAADTAAQALAQTGRTDGASVAEAASKVYAELNAHAVAEGYDRDDIIQMIIGGIGGLIKK